MRVRKSSAVRVVGAGMTMAAVMVAVVACGSRDRATFREGAPTAATPGVSTANSSGPSASASPGASAPATPSTAPSAGPSKGVPTPPPPPPPAVEAKTARAARTAIDRERAYAAAGDWGAVWDMLSRAGRDAMSRSDYVAVVSRCPKVYPNDTVRSITLSGNKTAATITSDSVGGGTYQWTLLYQNSHWRRQPSDGALHWMKLGRSGALAFLAPC
jgi:hypothetical protein